MNRITHYLIALLLSVTSLNAWAHSSNFSGFLLSKGDDGQYLVQFHSALTGMEAQINRSGATYSDAEAFKQLALTRFKQTVQLRINQRDVTFDDLNIQLGHNTIISARLSTPPTPITTIELHNTFFEDIPRNQMRVIFKGSNLPSEHYTLNKTNHHQLNIALNNGHWQATKHSTPTPQTILDITPKTNKNDKSQNLVVAILVAVLIASFIVTLFLLHQKSPEDKEDIR